MVRLGQPPPPPKLGFDEILNGVQTLGAASAPDLEAIKERWGDAANFYTELTTVQRDHLRDTLCRVLIVKGVNWNLTIADISKNVLWELIAGGSVPDRDRTSCGIMKRLGLRPNSPS